MTLKHCIFLVTIYLRTWCIFAVNPKIKEHYACFSTVFEVSCKDTEVLVFEDARYGHNDTRIAQDCKTPYQKNCDIDVHFTLNRRCAGKQKCSLAVNTALFDDPCGYDEFLKVKYQCVAVPEMSHSCHDTKSPPLFDNGYISSPNYPGKYYRDAECVWHLAVQRRQTILITIYDFELDVKKSGQCTDFLEISSGNRVYFKECGALGKQPLTIDSNQAVVRFKTSLNSLAQRGFLMQFKAIGPGCPDIENLPHGSVLYYVRDDKLFANASCENGYIFPGTLLDHIQVTCNGKYWSMSIRECIAIPPNTTPIGLKPAATKGPQHTTEEATGAVIGIALGVVSALLLLTLLLVIILYWQKRRRHRKAEKEHWRVVVNNLQENEINSYDEEQNWKLDTIDGKVSPTCNIKKTKKKKNKKQNNNCDDDFQGRNLLVGQGYDDSDDPYMLDYSDLHRNFQQQQSTPVKGMYNEPIYNRPPSRTSSRRNSRSSKYGFNNRQQSREGGLDYATAPPKNKSFCVECGTTGRKPQSQRDLRHKRAKSGHWEPHRSFAYTPSPEVPVYGFPRPLTQSAPDLLELCAEPVTWTLPPDQTYAILPPPVVVNELSNHKSSRATTPKTNRAKIQYVMPPHDGTINDIRC